VRVKTSITLPKDLPGRLDRVDKNRSALLERAALAYLNQLERQGDRNDVEIIDWNAERLNREAMDTLEYQQLRLLKSTCTYRSLTVTARQLSRARQ
jgi:metal-responsive CopG/Arc/MetJ family transcriptional regulator